MVPRKESVSIQITKPTTPILIVDTNWLLEMVKCERADFASDQCKKLKTVKGLIKKLVRSKKLLCPIGDQDEEYWSAIKDMRDVYKLQLDLSCGVKSLSRFEIRDRQTGLAARSYMSGDSTVKLGYSDVLFREDPFKQLERALKSGVIIGSKWRPDFYINLGKKTKTEIASDFERLRKEKLGLGVKYKDWVEEEKNGLLGLMQGIFLSALRKRKASQPFTEEESSAIITVAQLARVYKTYTKSDPGFNALVRFLKSDCYRELPYNTIQARLHASLLTQQHVVKQSDHFDFEQAASFLPYATFFTTDKSLKNRLESLKLDVEFEVKLFSMRDMDSLLSALRKL